MDLTGKRISHFEVLREISRGGMGVVYEALDTKLQRHVAIKTLRGEPNDAARLRFATEARSASRLGHPYVCQVLEILETEGEMMIVMELLQGKTLQEQMNAGPMRLSDALRIGTEIAEALREAHKHGIIHRDIKPSNIFLTKSDHIKITDFGLARLSYGISSDSSSAQTEQTRLTGTGMVMGTAGYMSPEQALGSFVDPRTDIFSLGVVLFEMLTGLNPFAGSNLAEYFHNLFTQVPISVQQLRSNVPAELGILIATMLSRDPEKRPSSMEEVYRKLIQISASDSRSMIQTKIAIPKTQYTRSGEINIAYQVLGDGPIDLVYVPGWISHLEYGWESARVAQFFQRLASFSRLILFDKRGTGMSDRVSGYPTLEDRMDDVRAVMDAVGSERAVIFGMSEGGNMSMLFAATYPERTVALIVSGCFAKRIYSHDYPWAPTMEEREEWYKLLESDWGGKVDVDVLAPTLVSDPKFVEWWSTYLRLGASPGAVLQLAKFNTQIDVRNILPAIQVPTLVMHSVEDRDVSVENGRYIARHIPGATYVELPGKDHLVYGEDADQILDEIEKFVTKGQATPQIDRILSTVLCARVPRNEHRDAASALLKQQLFRFRGEEILSDKDCIYASFDGSARAVRCACALAASGQRLGLHIHTGVHTGECEFIDGRLGGAPLDITRKLAESARTGEVLVTHVIKDLVSGANLKFETRDHVRLTGVEGTWLIFSASVEI